MTNLLPKNDKHLIREEYRLRLVTVVLFAFSAVIIMASVLLIPSYFITYLKGVSGEEQIKIIRDVVAMHERDNVDQILVEAKQKLKAISSERQSDMVEVIQTILEEQSAVISLNSFVSVDDMIRVEGVARSRDDLVLFADRLEKTPLFVNVNLPLSNLAPSKDIRFSFDMKIIAL